MILPSYFKMSICTVFIPRGVGPSWTPDDLIGREHEKLLMKPHKCFVVLL